MNIRNSGSSEVFNRYVRDQHIRLSIFKRAYQLPVQKFKLTVVCIVLNPDQNHKEPLPPPPKQKKSSNALFEDFIVKLARHCADR